MSPHTYVSLDIPVVLDRLRHRYPSLLVDSVVEHEPGRRVRAVKNVTVNEEYFQGHFPGNPLMPGVMMIETLMQAATLLLLGPGERRADQAGGVARRQQRKVPQARCSPGTVSASR